MAEILLRLPPKPSSLPHASLVCKRWRSIATDAAFCRCFCTHHRKPPILGIFEIYAKKLKFRPLLYPPDRIPSERFSLDLSADKMYSWRVLGCRHGRVLLLNQRAHVLLVFEPVSGDTLRIRIPPELVRDGFATTNAAVLCAAGGNHVHGDCHTSSFKVVLIGYRKQQQPAVACVYSSDTGIWGDVALTAEPCTPTASTYPCILIGTALYCQTNTYSGGILEFDLDNQSLSLIKPPVGPVDKHRWFIKSHMIRAQDGGLGLAISSYPGFQLWDRKVDCHGVATWGRRKNVNMDKILGPKANDACIVGYAEDDDVIIVLVEKLVDKDSYNHVLTMVQLESMTVKECGFYSGICYALTNFYTAGTARA